MTLSTEKLRVLEDIVGPENVSFDEAEIFCYLIDASDFPLLGLHIKRLRPKPSAVVRPQTTEDVVEIIKFARKNKIPVTPRGAGTSLAGQAYPIKGGIIMDMRKMDKIMETRIEDLQVVVEPGVRYKYLDEKLRENNFFFPPEPGSAEICTVGGMVACNASGIRAIKYGATRDWVLGLEVVLPNGEVIKTGTKALKSSSGYDLTRLFVGSEGTLGVITEVTLKILPAPESEILALAGFNSVLDLGKASVETISSGILPSAMEIVTERYIDAMAKVSGIKLPQTPFLLMVNFDGIKESVNYEVSKFDEICRKNCVEEIIVITNSKEIKRVWYARHWAVPMLSKVLPPPAKMRVHVPSVHDIGVPISKVPDLLVLAQETAKKYNLAIYPIGHIGDGNVHIVMTMDITDKDMVERCRKAADEIYEKVLEWGGTVTAEHGIGLMKAAYMSREHGLALEVMRRIKKAIDPDNIMNPGQMALDETPKDIFSIILEEIS